MSRPRWSGWRPGPSIPVGDDDDAVPQTPGLGFWTLSQAVVATKVASRWVLGLETGLLLPFGDRDGARLLGFGSVGTGYQVTHRVKPEIELNYSRDVFDDDFNDNEVLAITAGLITNPKERIRVDLGLRREIQGQNTDRGLSGTLNVSINFGHRDRSASTAR